jgi:dienelactone hydrolase
MLTEHASRLDLEFLSHGQRCAAWLYLPRSSRPAPVIVMAHGLGAVRTMRLDAYAERFQAAGYACLVFDYRHFGDSAGEPRQLLDIGQQLADWGAAIEFVRQRSDVDTSQVVVWGSSFGGGHAIFTGATQPGIAAVIAQCPFTDGLASALATSPLTSLQVTLLAIADQVGAWFGARPLLVATSGKPHTAALMTAPDAEPGYLQLVAAGSRFVNKVAARFGLHIIRYFPGRKARLLRCPALFCVCEADSVAPASATLRHVRKAPRGEIKMYPEGHFDIYVGAGFERVVQDQLQFLRQHVPAQAPA